MFIGRYLVECVIKTFQTSKLNIVFSFDVGIYVFWKQKYTKYNIIFSYNILTALGIFSIKINCRSHIWWIAHSFTMCIGHYKNDLIEYLSFFRLKHIKTIYQSLLFKIWIHQTILDRKRCRYKLLSWKVHSKNVIMFQHTRGDK